MFVISVAAELTGLHAQTLRQYDRLGLVSPGRTAGGGRRYSRRDIAVLREVARLSGLGIGLEGVRQMLELEAPRGACRPGSPSSRPSSTAFGGRDRRTALVVWRPDHPQARR